MTTIFQAEERGNGKALRVAGRTTLADSCFVDEVNCGINPSQLRLWAYPARVVWFERLPFPTEAARPSVSRHRTRLYATEGFNDASEFQPLSTRPLYVYRTGGLQRSAVGD